MSENTIHSQQSILTDEYGMIWKDANISLYLSNVKNFTARLGVSAINGGRMPL